MRVTRIDLRSETSAAAAIVREGTRVKACFYTPGETAPFRPDACKSAAIGDASAMWMLAAWVQRGLEYRPGSRDQIAPYLVVLETLAESD